jgi:hypothetical protein
MIGLDTNGSSFCLAPNQWDWILSVRLDEKLESLDNVQALKQEMISLWQQLS